MLWDWRWHSGRGCWYVDSHQQLEWQWTHSECCYRYCSRCKLILAVLLDSEIGIGSFTLWLICISDQMHLAITKINGITALDKPNLVT